ITIQRGIEANDDGAFRWLHDEWGHPQQQTRSHYGAAQAEILFLQFQYGFLPCQKAQYPDSGNRLRNDGSQRRTFDPHMETENENGVKYDIDDGTNDNGGHTDFGKSLCGDESIQTQGKLYENSTQRINAHIVHGIADGVFTGAECHKKRLRES